MAHARLSEINFPNESRHSTEATRGSRCGVCGYCVRATTWLFFSAYYHYGTIAPSSGCTANEQCYISCSCNRHQDTGITANLRSGARSRRAFTRIIFCLVFLNTEFTRESISQTSTGTSTAALLCAASAAYVKAELLQVVAAAARLRQFRWCSCLCSCRPARVAR